MIKSALISLVTVPPTAPEPKIGMTPAVTPSHTTILMKFGVINSGITTGPFQMLS